MDNGRIVNGKMHHGMIGHGTIPRSPTQPKEKKIKERRAKEKASMARTTASPMERTAQLSLQILLRSARRLSLRTFLSWQPRRRMKHSSFSPDADINGHGVGLHKGGDAFTGGVGPDEVLRPGPGLWHLVPDRRDYVSAHLQVQPEIGGLRVRPRVQSSPRSSTSWSRVLFPFSYPCSCPCHRCAT